MIWTAEHDARLKELWPTTPGAEIARQFGCAKSTIYARVSRLGLTRSFYGNDAVSVWFTIPRTLRDELAAEGRRKNMPPSGVLASILYDHYGVERPVGFNPWGKNGGKREVSAAKVKMVPRAPSMPFVPMGRD